MRTVEQIRLDAVALSNDRTVVSHDTLLQLSRRLDWRFLLPQPELQSVAYVGREDPSLVHSLQHFCNSVTLLRRSSQGVFPFIVACNPTLEEYQFAIERLAGGGIIYSELAKATKPPPGQTIASARQCVQSAFRGGLSEVQIHWHRPTFEACTEIIPLHDVNALPSSILRRNVGLRSKFLASAASLLVRSGILVQILPCVSVIARSEFGID